MVAGAEDDGGGPVAEHAVLAALVRSLGGPTRLAGHLGLTAAAVCQWYTRDHAIPPRHLAAVWRLAQARDVAWTPPGFEGFRLVPIHASENAASAALPHRENDVNVMQGAAA